MRTFLLGFLFSQDLDRVILLRKRFPEHQNGYLNGIDGEFSGTDYAEGMRNCTKDFPDIEWKHYGTVLGKSSSLDSNPNDCLILLAARIPDKVLSLIPSRINDEFVLSVELHSISIEGRDDMFLEVPLFIHAARIFLITGSKILWS